MAVGYPLTQVIRGLPMIRIAELDEELETELSPTSSQESKIER